MTVEGTSGIPSGAAGLTRRPWLIVSAFYVAATIAYAWPLLGALRSALPSDAGDPALNAWILWWNAHAVPVTARWWNAPIFVPARGALALSETLLSLWPLTTPLQWMGAGPITTYNIAFLLSFPAAALSAHALAQRLTGRHDAALLAGLAFGFSPYRAAQLPHLQMLWSCWMPLCLLALHRFADTRRARFLAAAGVCWLLNGLTSGYYLMFFAVLVGAWMLWFARGTRVWIGIGASLALASAALAPLLVGYASRQQALGLYRRGEEILYFSADLSGVWAVSPRVWLPSRWTLPATPEGELYPGIVVLALVSAGALVTWRRAGGLRWSRWRFVSIVAAAYLAEAAVLTSLLGPWRASIAGLRVSMARPWRPIFVAVVVAVVAVLADARTRAAWRRRSALFFYTAAAVVMLIFALGPLARLFGEAFWPSAPYRWLMELPGGTALRDPARFAMLFVLCLSQAAALAWARLARMPGKPLILGALALAVFLEGWVPRLPLAVTPAPVEVQVADRSSALIELPMQTLFSDTAAMLRATGHRLPLVNGFSGYFPSHYVPMREGLQAHDSTVLDTLRRFGPLLILIHQALDPAGSEDAFVRQQDGATLVETTPLGPLYRLPARAAGPGPAGSTTDAPLRISTVTATVNPGRTAAITDGDLETRWHSDLQTPGSQVVVTLASPARLSRVEMDMGRFASDFPRGLRVEIAGLTGESSVVWEGSTGGLAVSGALADPVRATITLALPSGAAGARLILTQTGRHPTMFWSIAELRVYGE